MAALVSFSRTCRNALHPLYKCRMLYTRTHAYTYSNITVFFIMLRFNHYKKKQINVSSILMFKRHHFSHNATASYPIFGIWEALYLDPQYGANPLSQMSFTASGCSQQHLNIHFDIFGYKKSQAIVISNHLY